MATLMANTNSYNKSLFYCLCCVLLDIVVEFSQDANQ